MTVALILAVAGSFAMNLRAAEPAHKPNIVFILADDLGYGDLSCYGQQKFKTPNIDRIADGGMKFTAHYSGHNVCAPARCVLLSGKHPGHAYIRDNRGGFKTEGQEPVPAGELQLPLTLKKLGYTIGGFGKWGLGPIGSTGDPINQGFDKFYGYNCQAVAHNYYPTHLWRNHDVDILPGNSWFRSAQKIPEPLKDEAAYNGAFRGEHYAPTVTKFLSRRTDKISRPKDLLNRPIPPYRRPAASEATSLREYQRPNHLTTYDKN